MNTAEETAKSANADRVRACVALLEQADYCLRETLAKLSGLPDTPANEAFYSTGNDIHNSIRILQRNIRSSIERYL